MKCDMCLDREADYVVRKSPPGSREPAKEHHLRTPCAGRDLQPDTLSMVRFARDGPAAAGA